MEKKKSKFVFMSVQVLGLHSALQPSLPPLHVTCHASPPSLISSNTLPYKVTTQIPSALFDISSPSPPLLQLLPRCIPFPSIVYPSTPLASRSLPNLSFFPHPSLSLSSLYLLLPFFFLSPFPFIYHCSLLLLVLSVSSFIYPSSFYSLLLPCHCTPSLSSRLTT